MALIAAHLNAGVILVVTVTLAIGIYIAAKPNLLLCHWRGSCQDTARKELVECCFTSTETIGSLGTGALDGHLDSHTAPELWQKPSK